MTRKSIRFTERWLCLRTGNHRRCHRRWDHTKSTDHHSLALTSFFRIIVHATLWTETNPLRSNNNNTLLSPSVAFIKANRSVIDTRRETHTNIMSATADDTIPSSSEVPCQEECPSPPSVVEEDLLAWRRDSESSFSDWKIEVIHLDDDGVDPNHGTTSIVESSSSSIPSTHDDDDGSTTTPKRYTDIYHVHRVFLASGSRKSEYFKTLFSMTMATEEVTDRTTRLRLHGSSCEAFPLLLDYLYGGESHLEKGMVTHLAVPILYLADYLQIPSLIPITNAFIIRDLNEHTVHVYCHEALLHGIEWVVQHCIHVAARFPHQLLPLPTTTTTTMTMSRDTSPNDENGDSASPFSLPSSEVPQSPSPVHRTMAMLPAPEQIQLLQLGLERSLTELRSFKQLPIRWKTSIEDVSASHLPVAAGITTYHQQSSGIPFHGDRFCPVFYYDGSGGDGLDDQPPSPTTNNIPPRRPPTSAFVFGQPRTPQFFGQLSPSPFTGRTLNNDT